MRILLVEDDNTLATALKTILDKQTICLMLPQTENWHGKWQADSLFIEDSL
jgi:DNA-binding response OmpR family regulator